MLVAVILPHELTGMNQSLSTGMHIGNGITIVDPTKMPPDCGYYDRRIGMH